MIFRHSIFTSNCTFTILGGITKRRGVVDVFKNSQPSSNGPSTSNVPPLMPPPMVAPAATNLAPTNFMVPGIMRELIYDIKG